jgi:hypothetical protein
MPTKTGYWIRVKNGKVTDVWDYKPSAEKLASEAGWREAVEIMPDLVANREIMTTHQINIDVEPAEIVWSKRELEVDERKDGLRSQAKAAFKQWSMQKSPRKPTSIPRRSMTLLSWMRRALSLKRAWMTSPLQRPKRLLTLCKE